MAAKYLLPCENAENLKLGKAWLQLGIVSLLFSGLFSILLVVSRTPAIQNHIPFIDFFHTALVVHVDLSVLIWFTAFAATLWTLNAKNTNRLDWLAFYLALTGTGLLIITPFLVDGHPLMNNYIPVLQTPLFYLSLSLYTLGILLRIIRTLISPVEPLSHKHSRGSVVIGLWLAALAALIAIIIFLLSLLQLPSHLQGIAWFELLFWGSGHALQFTHMLMVFVVWILLLQQIKTEITINASLLSLLFILTFIPVLYSAFIVAKYDIVNSDYPQQFTLLMKYGSLSCIPLGLVILLNLFKPDKIQENLTPLRRTLWCSAFLFAAGGILGFMIEGVNVVIPAHYHGSIVGITLAFMGFSFYLLPLFGYPISGRALKLAKIQPIIYAAGQFMHITGLAWSGGYGVQRKTAGAAQGLDRLEEIAGMALMGTGGLIAIIGGILFVVIAYLAIRKR